MFKEITAEEYYNFKEELFTNLESMPTYMDGAEYKANIVDNNGRPLKEHLETLDEVVKFIIGDYIIKNIEIRNDYLHNIGTIWLTVIEEKYTFNELFELGYTFKEINKILKQQEEK